MSQQQGNLAVRHDGVETPCALVVAGEAPWRLTLMDELRVRGVSPLEAQSAEEALHTLSRSRVDLLFCDDELEQGSGLALLATARERHPRVGRVLVSDHEDGVRGVQAINEAGVSYLLTSRWEPDALDAALAAAAAPSPRPVPALAPRRTTDQP
ncbi:MAG: response regulator, partial [Myxococcales bacterium]|nr:response regulator [Myxococcales bacterium]